MQKELNRKILALTLPSIVSNITVPLLGLCDVTIMGHVGGASHIGAIAVGSMIFNVMYWLFGFLRMGTSGLTAQALGAHNLQQSAAMLRRGLRLAVAIGLGIILLQWPLKHLAFFLMQPGADVAALCSTYYNICVWGAPAMLSLYVLMGWFVGMQNTRIPMVIAIGQNVVNIATSLLLVVGLGMDIRGVATGTVVAQWAGLLAAVLLLYRYYGRMLRRHLSGKPGTPGIPGNPGSPGSSYSSFFRLNLDIFLRTLCLVSVNLYFTSAGAVQGATILAANTLLLQFFMFFSYVMDGFAFAGEALSGRYYGGGNRPMFRQTVIHIFGWGCLVAALFTAVYWSCGALFLRWLTSDAAVVALAADYLPWVWVIPFAGMAAFVWDGIFIGITATRGMFIACLVASVAFFLIFFLCFPTLQNHALWLAFIVYLLLRGLVQTLFDILRQTNIYFPPKTWRIGEI